MVIDDAYSNRTKGARLMASSCLKYVKSKYPIRKSNVLEMVLFAGIIIIAIMAWRFYLYKFLSKNILLIFVYVVSLVYYAIKYYELKNKQASAEYVSKHAEKCLNTIKGCLICKVAFILIVSIYVFFSLTKTDKVLFNVSILIYIMVVGYMLMNYQFVVIFKADKYLSGEGTLRYNEIMKIEQLKQLTVAEGLMIYTQITLKDGSLFYDKFMLDEFRYLNEKISQL